MKRMHLFAALLLSAIFTFTSAAFAQDKSSILNENNQITWLGLDFTQAKFIGSAYQFKDIGEITDAAFRDKYVPAWNQLFIDEMKKYDVAEAVHRTKVKYATIVTEKANAGIKGREFFSNDPDDYQKLDEQKIKALVKKYDFKSNPGIGLLFFIDGMSKGKEEAGAWVTFVDMDKRNVIYTYYKTGKAFGGGFKNYWAGAFLKILKDIKNDYKDWKK